MNNANILMRGIFTKNPSVFDEESFVEKSGFFTPTL
jgi:hypothetical protein